MTKLLGVITFKQKTEKALDYSLVVIVLHNI